MRLNSLILHPLISQSILSLHIVLLTLFSWGLIKNNSLKNQDNSFLVLLLPWILCPLWSYSDIQIRIPARMVEFGNKLPVLLILSFKVKNNFSTVCQMYQILENTTLISELACSLGLLCAKLLKFEIYIVVNLQGSARTSEENDIKKSEGNALLSFTVCCLFSFLVCCWCFIVCCWCLFGWSRLKMVYWLNNPISVICT